MALQYNDITAFPSKSDSNNNNNNSVYYQAVKRNLLHSVQNHKMHNIKSTQMKLYIVQCRITVHIAKGTSV